MNEIKYTTDGKKVVVIGNLNSQEKIVQEMFLVNGVEIPSGENFVVKSLHDAPAVSWKETEIKKVEDNYNSTRTRYDSELNRLRELHNKQTTLLTEKLKYFGKLFKNVNEDSFKMLINYLTGNIKYIVTVGYDPDIIEFEKFPQIYDKDSLRLVSIFGRDDGTMTYAIGQYSDYSGSNQGFMPFTNYEDAFAFFKGLLLSRGNYNNYTLEKAQKYNIELDAEKVKKYKDEQLKALKSNIDRYKSEIKKWEDSIEDISKK